MHAMSKHLPIGCVAAVNPAASSKVKGSHWKQPVSRSWEYSKDKDTGDVHASQYTYGGQQLMQSGKVSSLTRDRLTVPTASIKKVLCCSVSLISKFA